MSFAITVLLMTSLLGCDIAGQDEQEPTASLTGRVLDKDGQTPLSGIKVKFGTRETTTDANGTFTFSDLQPGQNLQLRIDAMGFDEIAENVLLQEGVNRRDILLVRKTLYAHETAKGRFRMFLPPGVAHYRSVLFFVAPPTVEARGFVNGERLTVPNPPSAEALVRLNDQATGLRDWALQHAVDRYGTALLGANLNLPATPQTATDILQTLTEIAGQSGHPELAQAPLILVGMSFGGCFAYDLTRAHSARVIGFITQKGGCLAFDGRTARDVPGYFFIGETDLAENDNITQVFENNRKQGAVWGFASEPGVGHMAVRDIDLLTNWIDTVVHLRLPASAPPGSTVTLNAVNEASGWLGDRQTFAIAEFAQYGGDPLKASWLPTMQTARDWQVFVTASN